MRIGLLGKAESLCAELDAAGVKWERFKPAPGPGVIVAASGGFIEVTTTGAALLDVAGALRAWASTLRSRDVMFVTKEHQVVHIKGMSVEDVERILKTALHVDALDTGKPEPDKLESK
jgi:hypothetical protein